ncbi:MAG: hypothetical protein Q9219_006672 [cf. Caloplaca sp. 3 TL-2023]
MVRDKTTPAPIDKKGRTIPTARIFKQRGGNVSAKQSADLSSLHRPQKLKPNAKPEHSLSVAFSAAVENSRKCIDKKTTSQLDATRDELLTQARHVIQQTQRRMQEVNDSSHILEKPLSEETLEITRRGGTVVTTTLGKRMCAYRELLEQEEMKLHDLFEQYAEVSKQIEEFSAKNFRPLQHQTALANQAAEMVDFGDVIDQDLVAALETERVRIQNATALVGKKAAEAMRANEKVVRCSPFMIAGHVARRMTFHAGIEARG